MLELIFRGFFEWIYGLLMDFWWFVTDGLLDIMSLDFAYIQSHIPIIPQMSQLLLAVGWALLLGNLVFQALKSMAAGLGFEAEDPKLLFSRTFVFAFLLMASPQICRIGLDLTSKVMALLSLPDATEVGLVDESIFGTITASWFMAIICSVIVMFKVLGLVIEVAERYVVLAMLTITAPLAFAMGGSKNTAPIFSGWCRMFGSMCLLMVTNLVCCKMLFSTVSTVPSGLDVLPWMVLIFGIVKVAKKSDAIITRIGLNPALTGGGKSIFETLINTVVRTVTSEAVKGITGGLGGGSTSARKLFSSPDLFNRFFGGNMGGAQYIPRFSVQPSADGGSGSSSDSGTSRGGGRYGTGSSSQPSTGGESGSNSSERTSGASRRQNMGPFSQPSADGESGSNSGGRTFGGGGRYSPRSSAQPSADGRSGFSSDRGTSRGGGRYSQTRQSSVPPAGITSQMTLGQSGASALKRPHNYRPSAGSGTDITAGGGSTPRRSYPGGSAVSTSPSEPDRTRRSPKRENTDAVPKTPAAPVPGSSQPGSAERAARSTRRPPGSASRPGRNIPPDTAAPPAGGTASGPARQETRRPAASASPSMKGGAPTVRPGQAGTARTGQRAADAKQSAAHSSKRAQSVRRPPLNS